MSIRKFRRQIVRAEVARLERIRDNCPKPPRESGECACGCERKPDRGACPKYYRGKNDRCLICDHSLMCHRRKGEKPPADWNPPIALRHPRIDLIPPSSPACPHCKIVMIQCPKCSKFLPLKSFDSGQHIGNCPDCGHFSRDCPKMETCDNCKAKCPTVGKMDGKKICCAACVFNPLGCRCKWGEYGVEETRHEY